MDFDAIFRNYGQWCIKEDKNFGGDLDHCLDLGILKDILIIAFLRNILVVGAWQRNALSERSC